jgi:hypothetical protein
VRRTGAQASPPGNSSFKTREIDMSLINDAFISRWHPKYDETETDEPEYQRLVDQVARDMRAHGTLLQKTFIDILRWKKAIRAVRHVRLDEYGSLYQGAFRRAAAEVPARKLAALLAPECKLPGIGAAAGSTILHFIHPRKMPIIDVRTIEVLFAAGLVSSRAITLTHYEEFRYVMDCIRHRFAEWNLREIDRALFAYHKQVLAHGLPVGRRRAAPAWSAVQSHGLSDRVTRGHFPSVPEAGE